VKQPLLVLGTRTLAAEIADLAAQSGFRVAGFVENLDRERCREPLDGLPVHWIDDVEPLTATHLAVCGIATTRRSRFVADAAERGLGFAVVVHPAARVSAQSSVGEGSIVSPGAVVASHTTLGRHVLVNRGVLIGHHTNIGDFVSLQPGANVAGACRIGAGAYVGMGALVLDHLSVGAGAIVGAGAVVTREVPPHTKVLGMPARVVEEDVEPL
jgi:sugar O-acyltransferase (sialic acid O-acetyltransferase NeuD family)